MKQRSKKVKAFDKMAYAVAAYVKEMGGTALVLGGTGFIPRDGKFKYTLCIDILGKPPLPITGKSKKKRNN